MIRITKDAQEMLDYALVRLSPDAMASVSYTIQNDANIDLISCELNKTTLVDNNGTKYAPGTVVTLWVDKGDVGKSSTITLTYTTLGGRTKDDHIVFTIIEEDA